jgi:putative exosortase-associated protein (TIGR04073 family)
LESGIEREENAMIKKSMTMGLVVGLAVAFSGNNVSQAQTPTEKLGRGLANSFLGVLEVPNQMVNTYRANTGKQVMTKNSATVKMLFVGPVKGVREGIRRTGHGLWDTVTFLSPGPGKKEYRSRIKPEFITEEYGH